MDRKKVPLEDLLDQYVEAFNDLEDWFRDREYIPPLGSPEDLEYTLLYMRKRDILEEIKRRIGEK